MNEIENVLLPTLNSMGYSLSYPDIIQKSFINYSSQLDKPVLDVGAAFGVATLPALMKGAKVIANDIDQRHLKIIIEKTPPLFRSNLITIAGRMPYDISFDSASMGAVLIARVLHFFSPKEILTTLRMVWNWLCPNGKVFIVVSTPFIEILKNFLPIYEKKKKENDLWAGLISDASFFLSENIKMPNYVNLFDKEILERNLTETNFLIEDLFYFPAESPKKWLFDGREFLGCIARKLSCN